MSASQKIITKLRDRRQIEARLREMLETGSDLERRHQAQQIAALGSQVIPTIIGNLDRADSRMLSAMGLVAAHMDRDQVSAALRQAVLQARLTDQGRIGALTILERFLGQPPDDSLLLRLADPETVALSSLEEILDQAVASPAILVDYVQGLDRQEPDVVLAVLRALEQKGSTLDQPSSPGTGPGQGVADMLRAVEPLRMMAQDVREEIAAAALGVLGAFRIPEAVRALQTLIPTSAPELRPSARRAVRKLQFAGIRVDELPAPDPSWRALASPVDSAGQQSVWFILGERDRDGRAAAHARFLNILLSDRAGAFEAAGHAQVPVQILPPRRAVGYLHDLALSDGSGAMLMLELPFDRGRRLVLDALARNRETQIPVAGPLRLLSPWLWGYAGADSLPPSLLPVVAPEDDGLLAMADRLLEHPAMVGWTARSEAVLQAAEEALRHPHWDLDVWVKRLADDLFVEPAVARALDRHLVALSEWLLLAGDETHAKMALITALAVREGDPRELAFVKALVRRDLELIMDGLEHRPRNIMN